MLSHVPPWVFGILALLVFLGHRQSRPRELAPSTAFAIAAAMASLSLWGVVSAFQGSPQAIVGWVAGMSMAVTIGARVLVPRGIVFVPASGRVHVPGSWTPMALILCIFSIKFALGYAAGVGAPVTAHSALAVPVALVLGTLSGGFAARALEVWRASRRAVATV